MFDDILNAAAPAGGDAAAPAGGAPAARAKVNGRAGTRLSFLSTTRLQLGLVRSRVKQFESRVRLSAQSFSQHVAGVCYSNARPNDSHQMAVCDQGPGKITTKNGSKVLALPISQHVAIMESYQALKVRLRSSLAESMQTREVSSA